MTRTADTVRTAIAISHFMLHLTPVSPHQGNEQYRPLFRGQMSYLPHDTHPARRGVVSMPSADS